ncbi:MAG: nuclear transport factor 2 family protein [Terracidiphilus sp.]
MTETTNLVGERELLKAAYRDFNARNLEAVLARLHPEVEWANGMEGGHVHGRDGVREYWTRQWAIIDPNVDPIHIELDEKGRLNVEVHQVVRDLKGAVLLDKTVHHAYRFADGLIKRMDIE